jgi:hypothetical protein
VSRGVNSQHDMAEKAEKTVEENTGQHGQEVYN